MKKSLPLNKAVFKSKFRAALIHFLFSLMIFLAVVGWLISVLYPSFQFKLNGGVHALQLLIGVDLVLGPLLTLLVFHPMKGLKERIGDFTVIGIVQLAALAYGLNTMYQQHPKMLVFYDYGRIEVITQQAWETNPNSTENFPVVGGVPTGAYQVDTGAYIPLTVQLLSTADPSVRSVMTFEDKAYLSHLEKQHGRLYAVTAAGKYKTVNLALNDKMEVVAEFGWRDI